VSQKHCVSSQRVPKSKAASGMVDSLLNGSGADRTVPPVGPTNPGGGPQRDSQSYASRRPRSPISCKAWQQPPLAFRAPQLQGQKWRNSMYLIAKRLYQTKSFGTVTNTQKECSKISTWAGAIKDGLMLGDVDSGLRYAQSTITRSESSRGKFGENCPHMHKEHPKGKNGEKIFGRRRGFRDADYNQPVGRNKARFRAPVSRICQLSKR